MVRVEAQRMVQTPRGGTKEELAQNSDICTSAGRAGLSIYKGCYTRVVMGVGSVCLAAAKHPALSL